MSSTPASAAASRAVSRNGGTVISIRAPESLQLVAELASRVERVGGGVRGAGGADPVERQRVLRQVGHVEADDVALADPPFGQAGGDAPHAPVDLGSPV